MKWKVPFKREAPKPDHAHFVIAYKTASGQRMEFYGQVPQEVAFDLMTKACGAAKAASHDTNGGKDGKG